MTITSESTNGSCGKCRQSVRGEALYCYSCLGTFHPGCENITPELTKLIEEYYCRGCLDKPGCRVVWKRVPSLVPRNEKKLLYFEITRITSHRTADDGTTHYQCEWSRYKDDNGRWICGELSDFMPITNYLGAVDLIQEYRQKNKMPYMRIQGTYGSDGSETAREINFANGDQMLQTIAMMRTSVNYQSKRNIPVVMYKDRLETGEAIHLVPHDRHIFVCYNDPSSSKIFAADGLNFTLQNETRVELERILGKPLVTCLFLQQRRPDTCASSAVAICLAILRESKAPGDVPLVIRANSSELQRAKLRLHPEPSAAIKTRVDLNLLRPKCPSCGTILKKHGKHLHRCKVASE